MPCNKNIFGRMATIVGFPLITMSWQPSAVTSPIAKDFTSCREMICANNSVPPLLRRTVSVLPSVSRRTSGAPSPLKSPNSILTLELSTEVLYSSEMYVPELKCKRATSFLLPPLRAGVNVTTMASSVLSQGGDATIMTPGTTLWAIR